MKLPPSCHKGLTILKRKIFTTNHPQSQNRQSYNWIQILNEENQSEGQQQANEQSINQNQGKF